jgi:hypothetical protein
MTQSGTLKKKTAGFDMEIWKDIEGYQGSYQVSNLGRVKSLLNSKEIILKPINSKGYSSVFLSNGKGTVKKFKIHRLVCICFLPNLENKPQVNHINGIKTDNRLENLEWSDNSSNQIHAIKTGLKVMKYGSNHGMSKLTEDQVKKIKYEYNDLFEYQIAEIYGITQANVNFIRRGKTWRHV